VTENGWLAWTDPTPMLAFVLKKIGVEVVTGQVSKVSDAFRDHLR
jgi:hypothetical protein